MILLFALLPMIELFLLINLGSRIGPMPTIGLIVLTGIIGASLARHQGLSVLSRIRSEMAAGKPPTAELLEGALVVVAGIVLITPGIVTDLFGFLLLIPSVRRTFCENLKKSFSVKVGQASAFVRRDGRPSSHAKDGDDVIEV